MRSQGITVFESCAPKDALYIHLNDDKSPHTRTWGEDNALTYEQAKTSKYVLGMICGGSSSIAVLDLDVKEKLKDGTYRIVPEFVEKAKKIKNEFYAMHKTLIVSTPSDGTHIYVKIIGEPLFEDAYRKINVPVPGEIRGGKKRSYVVTVGQKIKTPFPGEYKVVHSDEIVQLTSEQFFDALSKCGIVLPDFSGSGDDWNAGLEWLKKNEKDEDSLRTHLMGREHFSKSTRAYQDLTIQKLLNTFVKPINSKPFVNSLISDNIVELENTYKDSSYQLIPQELIRQYYDDSLVQNSKSNFNMINNVIPIPGNHNLAVRVQLYYFTITTAFPVVRLDLPRPHDTRINLNMIAPQGMGKTTSLGAINQCLDKTNGTRIKRVKISHSQQLIGSYTSDKKNPVFIPGYIHERALAIDEAEKVLNETTDIHADSMAILRQAQDTYGSNKIDTKLVKIPSEEIEKQPYPQAQIILLSHPGDFSPAAIGNGELRRTFSCEPKTENCIDSDSFSIELQIATPQKIQLPQINAHTNLIYRDEDKELIDVVYKALVFECSSCPNERIRNFMAVVFHSVTDLILKVVTSAHIVKGFDKTNTETTISAICDFLTMYDENLKVLAKYAKTDLFYSQWGDVDVLQARCLKVLLDGKHFTSDTGLATTKFKEIVATVYGCDVERTVRRHVSALKEKNLIAQKQTGQYEHMTYLLRAPEKKKVTLSDKFWLAFDRLPKFGQKISIREDREGILWHTLYTYLYTYQLSNFCFNNYIIEKGGCNPLLPVPPELSPDAMREDTTQLSTRRAELIRHLQALSHAGFDEEDVRRLAKNDGVTIDIEVNRSAGYISHHNGKYKLENALLLKVVRAS